MCTLLHLKISKSTDQEKKKKLYCKFTVNKVDELWTMNT